MEFGRAAPFSGSYFRKSRFEEGEGTQPRGADRRRPRRLFLDGALARARAGGPPVGVRHHHRRRPISPRPTAELQRSTRIRLCARRRIVEMAVMVTSDERYPARRRGDEAGCPVAETALAAVPRSTSTRRWRPEMRSDRLSARPPRRRTSRRRRREPRSPSSDVTFSQPGRLQAVRGPARREAPARRGRPGPRGLPLPRAVETGDAAVADVRGPGGRQEVGRACRHPQVRAGDGFGSPR